MQLQVKFIRLDLNYSVPVLNFYQRERLYIAPFIGEAAEHFARRLLSFLMFYPEHPKLNQQDNHGKAPDLFVLGDDQHFKLWCQVDPLTSKQLQKACHQSDVVWLILPSDQAKLTIEQGELRHKVHQWRVQESLLLELLEMLQPHLQLSVWRDDDVIQITNGHRIIEWPCQLSPQMLH